MSGVSKAKELADQYGWSVLNESLCSICFYKWKPGGVRFEVNILHDAMGRIECLTTWENRRLIIRHQPGVRSVTESVLRETAR